MGALSKYKYLSHLLAFIALNNIAITRRAHTVNKTTIHNAVAARVDDGVDVYIQ